MCATHKEMSDNYIKLSSGLLDLATLENSNLADFLSKLSETFEKMRRFELLFFKTFCFQECHSQTFFPPKVRPIPLANYFKFDQINIAPTSA